MSNRIRNSVVRLFAVLICGLWLSAGASHTLLADSAAPAAMASTSSQSRMFPAERREEMHQKKIDNPEAEEGANVYRHSATVHVLAKIFGLSVESTARLFETINFVLLVALIVWGIVRVLPKTLRSRTERIRNEIEQARAATAEASRRLSGVEERLSHLDSEIAALRERAEQETVLEEKHLREALEQEKQSIVTAATQDIDAATKNAQAQLKRLAAELVIEHAQRKIQISPETDRSLVEGFVKDVKDTPPRGGVN
jgi:F-type H+-transporting ATPase subunit b